MEHVQVNRELIINFINKLKKPDKTSKEKTTNPFTSDGIGNKETDDRYMNIAISVRNWQLTSFGLLVAVIIMAVQLGNVAVHSKIETRVALVNDGMVINTLRTDDLTPTEKELLVDNFVKNFIIDARLVSTDEAFEKHALDNIDAMASGKAKLFLDEYYKKNDPFAIASKYTTSVEVVNATEVSLNTWQVWWDETKRSEPDGNVIDVSRWYAQLSYKETEADPKHIKQNPFGFYVTQLTWSKSQ